MARPILGSIGPSGIPSEFFQQGVDGYLAGTTSDVTNEPLLLAEPTQSGNAIAAPAAGYEYRILQLVVSTAGFTAGATQLTVTLTNGTDPLWGPHYMNNNGATVINFPLLGLRFGDGIQPCITTVGATTGTVWRVDAVLALAVTQPAS